MSSCAHDRLGRTRNRAMAMSSTAKMTFFMIAPINDYENWALRSGSGYYYWRCFAARPTHALQPSLRTTQLWDLDLSRAVMWVTRLRDGLRNSLRGRSKETVAVCYSRNQQRAWFALVILSGARSRSERRSRRTPIMRRIYGPNRGPSTHPRTTGAGSLRMTESWLSRAGAA